MPDEPPFTIEIVATQRGSVALASGVPVEARRAVSEIATTDIIIVPSRPLCRGRRLGHAHACRGRAPVLGLLGRVPARRDRALRRPGDHRPLGLCWRVQTRVSTCALAADRVLVVSGEREELVTSGASMTWHDLVLYLIARHVGATAAQTVARFFALQWHHEGLAPYIVFQGRNNHGDAAIADAQAWLSTHFSVGSPVEETVRRSGLAERTFKRRFTEATGLAPIDYIQRLRIEDAKRRLERTDAPVDEISWQVGYEDAAFFRRLFKRVTGLTPGAYRRRFQVPSFARSQRK